MSVNRGAIYAALFALVETTPGFAVVLPRLKYPDDQAAQPALFLRRTDDHYEQRAGGWGPAKVVLTAELIIYYRGGADEDCGAELDNLIGNVEAQLEPGVNMQTQNLGLAYVERCRINGTIKKDDGSTSSKNQAGAIIPIEIITTSWNPTS
jgi:hypothetical protein